MKFSLILIVLIMFVGCASNEPKSQVDVDATLEVWKGEAGQYQGNLLDLSDASKRAIVLGKPEIAEGPMMLAYNSELGRKLFGATSLYQIFLVYIDPVNVARDTNKAKWYLDKLESEFPDSEEATKANAVYAGFGL